jgi:DNA-directed RNA polymerase specialized sigma subunit
MSARRHKRELTERNQRMLIMRHNGMTLREIGEVFGVSDVRVLEICRREEGREQVELAHNSRSNLLTKIT